MMKHSRKPSSKHLQRTYTHRARRLRPQIQQIYEEKKNLLYIQDGKPEKVKKFLSFYKEVHIPHQPVCLYPHCINGKIPKIIIDIGFGAGESILQIASISSYRILGIEVYQNGIAKLFRDLPDNALKNIRVMQGSALYYFSYSLPSSSIDAIHIFFPDPWIKKRHHKRRLLQKKHMNIILKPLKIGGYLYFTTDWHEYAEQVYHTLMLDSRLRNRYYRFAPRQEWRAETKYEKKAQKEGRICRELLFDKIM